ncbi:MAG: hypothetical protein IPM14_06650, partial [bacterium]|nr:hypothetical protein [bacterium]
MKKLIIILLISTCVGSVSTLANFDRAYETKNILILFSLVPTTPAYRTILDGIR